MRNRPLSETFTSSFQPTHIKYAPANAHDGEWWAYHGCCVLCGCQKRKCNTVKAVRPLISTESIIPSWPEAGYVLFSRFWLIYASRATDVPCRSVPRCTPIMYHWKNRNERRGFSFCGVHEKWKLPFRGRKIERSEDLSWLLHGPARLFPLTRPCFVSIYLWIHIICMASIYGFISPGNPCFYCVRMDLLSFRSFWAHPEELCSVSDMRSLVLSLTARRGKNVYAFIDLCRWLWTASCSKQHLKKKIFKQGFITK